MNIFETKKVFSQELLGKAVEVVTMSGSANGIIIDVQESEIEIVGVGGVKYFNVYQIGASVKLKFLVPEQEPVKVIEANDTIYVPAAETIKKVDGRAGRRYTVPFIRRTPEQVKADNDILVDIMANHIEPLRLQKIVKLMNKRGRRHWNTNNATAFIKLAMRDGRPIKHLERGLYVINFTGGIGQ